MALKIYDSLSRKTLQFSPIKENKVGMYTCGPTVYDFLHIGNWRTQIFSDTVRRGLVFLGYQVKSVMNITDVGHMTSDADSGEDKLEKSAKKQRKNVSEIADMYTKDFLNGMKELNILHPDNLVKATKHIQDQIDLIQKLEENKVTYKTSDGIYFDTEAFEKMGNVYGELSDLDSIREGARVEKNIEKKNPRDFALWKFSTKDEKREMEWDSPWGVGFPGWHIECSAMSMKYLGKQFDIHIGGEDLKSTHHPNEIAQSEAATGCKPFVKYWMHGAFVKMNNGKMSKSLGTGITLQELRQNHIHPISYRYFVLNAHYRSPLNFTWDAVRSSQTALERFVVNSLSLPENNSSDSEILKSFNEALENDFNTAEALAVLNKAQSISIIQKIDSVLGLSIEELGKQMLAIPKTIENLIEQRNEYRSRKEWDKADNLRKEIENMGYILSDIDGKTLILKSLSLLTV